MEKIVYQGKIIEVVEKEVKINDKAILFEIARRSPGVRIIIRNGNKIYLSKEFRHEIKRYDMRLPGGKVFDTLPEYNNAIENNVDIDESARQAALKEAKEEAGIEINNLKFLHKSVCGATVLWDLYFFVTTDFREREQELEEDEDIEMEWVDAKEVKEMCLDGRISEERSALVLLRYLS